MRSQGRAPLARRSTVPASVRQMPRTPVFTQETAPTRTNRRRAVRGILWNRPQDVGTKADSSPQAELDRAVTGTRRVSFGTDLYAASTQVWGRSDLDRVIDEQGVEGLGSWLSAGKLNPLIGAVASAIPGGSAIANAILPQPQQQAQQVQYVPQPQQQAASPSKPAGQWFEGFTNKQVVTFGVVGVGGFLALLTIVLVATRK